MIRIRVYMTEIDTCMSAFQSGLAWERTFNFLHMTRFFRLMTTVQFDRDLCWTLILFWYYMALNVVLVTTAKCTMNYIFTGTTFLIAHFLTFMLWIVTQQSKSETFYVNFKEKILIQPKLK